MAKNSEVYKTSQERAKAFYEYCKQSKCPNKKSCSHCCGIRNYVECGLEWLDLEYEEEKPLPCVYCKGEVKCYRIKEGDYCICSECGATAPIQPTRELAIEMYNRVAKAVKESEDENG